MIHILTGRIDSGKTTLLERIINNLPFLEKRINGFLTPKAYEGDRFIGYNLLDLKRREVCPFIRQSFSSEKIQTGRFYFLPEGLERAIKIILRHQIIDYLIVDEIGPLELAGRGLWPALKQQLRRASFKGLLVIRIGLVDSFMSLLQGLEVRQFNMASPTVEFDLKSAIESLFPLS